MRPCQHIRGGRGLLTVAIYNDVLGELYRQVG